MTYLEDGRRRLRLAFHVGLVILTLLPSLGIAVIYLQVLGTEESPQRPFTDALTYLAAGDRLNLGHDLYRHRPDDLPVDLYPALFPVPMVGPPTMGVLARPLAAFDLGLLVWMTGCWAALLGAVTYLVVRVGYIAIAASIMLALPIAEHLAAGNAAAFLPLLLIIAWVERRRTVAGIAIGLMAGAKLAPIALAGWLIGTRDRRALLALAATLAVIGLLVVLFAGWANVFDYLRVMTTVSPSVWSISTLLGIPWASYVVLVGGSLLAIATARWPRFSFCVGVLAMTFGNPALYMSSLVTLLGLLAPLIDSEVFARYRLGRARSPA